MGLDSTKYPFGRFERGPLDLITDVEGIKVGHCTLSDGDVQTGVTAIIPCPDSPFLNKLPAACHVINGFGKTTGLMQIEELGTLESPILLTNTLSVPDVQSALIDLMLSDHPDIGDTTGTVNTVVAECNDGYLNDIRRKAVTKEHVNKAVENASVSFEEGSVGAGRGMRCYGLKGGIGSSSRSLNFGDGTYTVGTLLLTNFGSMNDLVILGKHPDLKIPSDPDKGSCIVIIATDLPLSSRQLKRICRRAQNGLARTGSYTGSGSGDVVIAFSTVNRVPHYSKDQLISASYLNEDLLDTVFEAVRDSVEESVISSLLHSETVKGRNDHTLFSLSCLDRTYQL